MSAKNDADSSVFSLNITHPFGVKNYRWHLWQSNQWILSNCWSKDTVIVIQELYCLILPPYKSQMTSQNLDRRAYAIDQLRDGRAGRRRRVAARGHPAGRRLHDRHDGRGHGSDVADPPDRLADRHGVGRDRLHRGARQLPRAVQATIPLGLRHAAVALETSPRHRPLRLVRAGDAAVALAVPGRLPGAVAADRPADSLDDRRRRARLDARPSRAATGSRCRTRSRRSTSSAFMYAFFFVDGADRRRWSRTSSIAKIRRSWSGFSGSASSTAS